jgi:peptidoglycan hydrolase-like protein with peptidoglycan-binding domain
MHRTISAALFLSAAVAIPAWAQSVPFERPVVEQPMSRDGVRAVQSELRDAGFYRGPIDGTWGRRTEAALGAYQENHGLTVTWRLDPATIRAMGFDPNKLAGRMPDRGPDFAAQPVLSRETVRRVQTRLAREGFRPGPADGIWGRGTEAALRDFQHARGLQPTGDLNPITARALGFDPNNLAAPQQAEMP